jgi:hypothetical protein
MTIRMKEVSERANSLISDENALFETIIYRIESSIDNHLLNFAKDPIIEFPLTELNMISESIRPRIIERLIQDYSQNDWRVSSTQKVNGAFLVFSGHLDTLQNVTRFYTPDNQDSPNGSTFISIPKTP